MGAPIGRGCRNEIPAKLKDNSTIFFGNFIMRGVLEAVGSVHGHIARDMTDSRTLLEGGGRCLCHDLVRVHGNANEIPYY